MNRNYGRGGPTITKERLHIEDIRSVDKPRLSPLSGSELPFVDSVWNTEHISESHNCYDYALNNLDYNQEVKSQPGDFSLDKHPKYINGKRYNSSPYSCRTLNDLIKKDNPDLYFIEYDKPCKNGFRKIAMLVSDSSDDYHFLRQDKTGTWSHKVGELKAYNVDAKGRRITDPRFADLATEARDYTDYCGTYCVPESRK